MKKVIETYEVEYYALFKNVDETILNINTVVEKQGYLFIALDMAELEEKFSSLYSLPDNYQTKIHLNLNENVIVSNEFYTAYQNHYFGGIDWSENQKVIFLKRKDNLHQEVIDNTIQIDRSLKALSEIHSFKDNLIKKLRLFKNGDIKSPVVFQISKESQQVESKLADKFVKLPSSKTYSILENEIDALKKHLIQDFETNELTRLAEVYFESCYELFDINTKFIGLITALESIFNRSNNQISHIIARHLSLIISNNKEEFELNYKRIKKLYGYRSQIVHGQILKTNENIYEATDELHDLTRKAILFCMRLKMDKDELFTYLNSKGF